MSQEIIRVMLVDDIADLRRNMEKLLLLEEDIKVVGSAGSGEEGIELARQLRPDVVIMDINMPGIDGISAAEILTRELPGIQIIMMSVQGEADYMRRSMLAGAREFLIKPSSTEEIVTSIRRVYNLSRMQRSQLQAAPAGAPAGQPASAAQAKPSQRDGNIVAVFGAKGGVGTSSVAANLAIALRQQRPDIAVAMVDGNTEFGDLTVLLNLTANRTIIDLLSAEELDPQFIQEMFISHSSGIQVIPGSPPTESELVSPRQIKRLIGALREQFDWVIFDTRPTFGEPILTILDDADAVVLVTTPEIPAIRNARLFFEVTDRLDYGKDKVKLVVNKHEPQGAVSSQAIQNSIKHPIAVELPRDDRLAGTAIQQGMPVTISNPRSPLAMAHTKLARSMMGLQELPQEAEKKAANKTAEPAKKQSLIARLFGR